MIPLLLARYWKLIVIVAAAGALVWGYFAWQGHQRNIGAMQERSIWESKIAEQKAEARKKLDEERAKTEEVEAKLTDARTTQETKDEANAKTIKSLAGDLRYFKRLRDPYAKSGSGCSGGGAEGKDSASASAGSGDRAETSGLLSEGFSDLLRNLAREADELNIAYASCRQDAMTVRELMK